MSNSASALTKAEPRFTLAELRRFADDWLLDSQLQQHSAQTIYCRRDYLHRLFWFFEHRGITEVGTPELKQFFLYLNTGHTEDGGRWGNPQMTQPMRPVSIHAYYRVFNAMFNWLVEDEAIESSPMRRIKPPVVRHEIKQPVGDEQVTRLLEAATRSKYAKRDEAILLVLIDTGIRAKELATMKIQDLDLFNRSFRVIGKGNRPRSCYLGKVATRALSKYLRGESRQPDDPVFITERGVAFTVSGLYQLIERLAKMAGVKNCSPHALRRTFAVTFLRASKGDVFACQNLLGHSDLQQSRFYASIAQADIENQHRECSPADKLTAKRR